MFIRVYLLEQRLLYMGGKHAIQHHVDLERVQRPCQQENGNQNRKKQRGRRRTDFKWNSLPLEQLNAFLLKHETSERPGGSTNSTG